MYGVKENQIGVVVVISVYRYMRPKTVMTDIYALNQLHTLVVYDWSLNGVIEMRSR